MPALQSALAVYAIIAGIQTVVSVQGQAAACIHVIVADDSVASHSAAYLVAELLVATVACWPLLELPPLEAFVVKRARTREADRASQAITALGAHQAARVPRFAHLTTECDLPVVTCCAERQLAGVANLHTTDRRSEA